MKLSDFNAGVAVRGVQIGMTVDRVQKILGVHESSYPTPGEYDKDLDCDEHFLCWRPKGIEVAFDTVDDHGQPTSKSRVVAIHVRGQEITNASGNSVSRQSIRRLHGDPNDAGDYTARGDQRRTWEYYTRGLQAVYDTDGWLVSLCVSKRKDVKK